MVSAVLQYKTRAGERRGANLLKVDVSSVGKAWSGNVAKWSTWMTEHLIQIQKIPTSFSSPGTIGKDLCYLGNVNEDDAHLEE